MSDTKIWSYLDAGNFAIDPVNPKRDDFDLDVDYSDSHYGNSTVSLDALEVYRALKGYFKGTEYE